MPKDYPKLADIIGKPSKAVEAPMADETEEEDAGTSEEEVSAMRMFSKASSPEQKAEALKMFLKACGVY